MAETLTIVLDGRELSARPGQTILAAADEAGVWIPRLCHKGGLEPYGGCRVCVVKANGRPVAACTQPVSPGLVVESDTPELTEQRRILVELLFVEGNHFCMSCEKSGNCELQALAYRLGIAAPRFEYLFPARALDASHPDILLDRNRCVLCARCVRSSRELDRKQVFGFAGRGAGRRIVADAANGLAGTQAHSDDHALDACPVGALVRKRVGFAVPVGARLYDQLPIGSGSTAAAPAEKP